MSSLGRSTGAVYFANLCNGGLLKSENHAQREGFWAAHVLRLRGAQSQGVAPECRLFPIQQTTGKCHHLGRPIDHRHLCGLPCSAVADGLAGHLPGQTVSPYGTSRPPEQPARTPPDEACALAVSRAWSQTGKPTEQGLIVR
jgi:hypothetical protein